MGNSNLMNGSKTAPITLKVTERFKKVLRQNWDSVNFPLTAKMKIDVPFKSESDFILTILRKDFSKSKFKFRVDMEVNNPDWEIEE